MKKIAILLALCLMLLAGCEKVSVGILPVEPTPAAEVPAPTDATPYMPSFVSCRIVDGAETGTLVLAKQDGGSADVFVVDATSDGIFVSRGGGSSGWDELRDGMLVTVQYNGAVLETFPAQLGEVKIISVDDDGEDLSGLYLQVLEDLWAVDSGLNDGITQLGVDFSELEGLTESEKLALAYAFGMKHGLMPISGTWEELKEQGYFTGTDPEADGLPAWEDGCLFKISGNTEEFTADKWRTALAAYVFYQCSAQQTDGGWTYEIGSEMIA